MGINKFKESFGIFVMLVGQGIIVTGGDYLIGLTIMIIGVVSYAFQWDTPNHNMEESQWILTEYIYLYFHFLVG